MDSHQALTEKEKQTLRLILRGHDAKSTARHLGLSVHTVNERLREARRKLSVSSSREAARRLFEIEGGGPETLVDKQLGDALAPRGMKALGQGKRANPRSAWIIGGVLVMSLIVAMLMSQAALQPVAVQTAAASESAALASAQSWLALVDNGRWNESWSATGQAFQKLNTAKTWSDLSEKVRRPLGAVTSRTTQSQEWLPAPPYGYRVIKFRTSFANKPDTGETVTLEREGERWKVVGYLIGPLGGK